MKEVRRVLEILDARVTPKLDSQTLQLEAIMAELTALKDAVARSRSVSESAVTLLEGLKAKLDAALADDDPDAIQAISDELGASTEALAAAVAKNTIADTTAPSPAPAEPVPDVPMPDQPQPSAEPQG